MAYFNPGCGAGSFAAFARYEDGGSSRLVSVDLEDGEVAFKAEIDADFTSPVTMVDGSVVAVSGGAIVHIDSAGIREEFATMGGRPFQLRLDSSERLAYLTADSATHSTARVINLRAEVKTDQVIAEGLLDRLGLARVGDSVFVLGSAESSKAQLSRVEYLEGAAPHGSVSTNGALVVQAASPAGMGASTFRDGAPAQPRISALAAKTGRELVFLIDPGLDASAGSSPEDSFVEPSEEPLAAPAMLDVRPLASPVRPGIRSDSATDPIEEQRSCAVPRNDPHNQAYQPKPREVQWAVDRAVRGQLTEQRDANWRNLGMPAYSPQGLFPRVQLVGGGTIPPQIMLGILAQESNLWQASRYTSPGSTGNPLVGDFYGSRPQEGEHESAIWDIDFSAADCGYGVGQITDRMRLAGRERPGDAPALPYDSQRAIALDYAANIAMAVRMLGQKWNEVKSAGMDIHGGDPERIENWFFAVWAYNTGFHEQESTGPWGVGWFNNPINPVYPANRSPFLDGSPSDAATPQYWPYPEKVLGFAAHSLDLPQTATADPSTRAYPTDYVAAFTTAWWPGWDELDAELNRRSLKPPVDLFCSISVNNCDPTASFPCLISGEPECWWHADAEWKTDCEMTCGFGEERFDETYDTEASSMGSHLPALTRQLSFPPNCQTAPAGVIVVDDVAHQPVRSECARQATQGSFEFQFYSPDANGDYSSKVDLHQQGGGFNGHFYWSHMRAREDPVNNRDSRLKITGRWSLGQSLDQWTRVWVHLPDHAAWTEQAAYAIDLGNGQVKTRHLPQRRYENSWVPLGVFKMSGTPSVSLSNIATVGRGVDSDDVAWDAVGFQPLPEKPRDFVVALGDSFSSGEGAGGYYAWTDHDGDDNAIRNGCHQSSNAWIRKTVLPDAFTSIGTKADSHDTSLDFHFLACSAAESENLLPFETITNGQFPANGAGETGTGQFGQTSQLDAGYLDENTTLVTLSIGGNDVRFADIISSCAGLISLDCSSNVLGGDQTGIYDATMNRLASELPSSLAMVLGEIKDRAPNATIVLVGYPRLFDIDTSCVMVGSINKDWLNEVADELTRVMNDAANAADSAGQRVVFADPQPAFQGHTLCASVFEDWGINGLVLDFTPGDKPFDFDGSPVSQQSVHPNDFGTTLYSEALEAALTGVY